MNSTLDLNTLSLFRNVASEYSRQGGDYVFIRLTDTSKDAIEGRPFQVPMRVEGMAWIMCFSGMVKLEINLVESCLEKGNLMIMMPGSIFELKDILWEGLDCYILFLSTDFIRNINIDLHVIGQLPRHRMSPESDPTIHMNHGEMRMLADMCELLRHNTETNGLTVYSQSIARSIIASLLYQGMQIVSTRFTQKYAGADETGSHRSRRSTYVDEFMRLVRTNFHLERSVSYYASRLCITPKYLSLIIKEHTGHTAGEVIDNFVILEAKNLLRFSGKNIQQVANALNFPSQSAFGKYFKHLTGQSPSEYQHS